MARQAHSQLIHKTQLGHGETKETFCALTGPAQVNGITHILGGDRGPVFRYLEKTDLVDDSSEECQVAARANNSIPVHL